MTEEKIIKSRKTAPDTKSWYEFFWREKQETANRIEDAAKFLATMISISLAIFLAIGKKVFESGEPGFIINLSVLCWLLALLVSFFVLFPWRYKFIPDSVKSMKEVHYKVVLVKYVLLIVSLILFMAALSLLAYIFLF